MQGFGSLQFGTGVLVVGVERIYDQLLANQLTTARSSEGRAEVANQYALRLEGLLGGDFDCWLTGGDADRLGAQLGRAVQHDPHLVLRGLALAGARS